MFTVEQYRAKAMEYSNLARIANNPNELREFQKLQRSYSELADMSFPNHPRDEAGGRNRVRAHHCRWSSGVLQLVAWHQEGALGHRKYCRRRGSSPEHLWTGGNNPLMALRETAFLGEFRPVFRKL
jgi:hypothetical protein